MKDLFFTLIFLLFSVSLIQAQKCHLRELDLCAASLLVSTQGQSAVGTTEKDLDRQCTFIKEADTCVRNFTKNCLTNDQRSLTTSLFHGANKLLKEYCIPGSNLRKQYLKHAPCLNTVMKEQKPCIRDLQVAFEEVTSSKWDKRLGLACCSYRRLRDCMGKIMKDKCGEETVNFFNELLQTLLSRLPDLMCKEFTLGSATCKKLPPPGTAPKGGRSTSILNRLLSAYTNI